MTDLDRGTPDSKGWSKSTREKVLACPREAEHRYGPSGYLAWHSWAEERAKTHRQRPCDCGLWLLLERKSGTCRGCGKTITLRQDGTLWAHGSGGPHRCPGSLEWPA
jgi:hypothetical protein